MKRALGFTPLLIIAALVLSAQVVYGAAYRGYTYDFWQDPMPAPQAYLPEKVILSSDLANGGLRGPQDIFVAGEEIYIADSGNNRVVVADHNWDVIRVIDSFDNNGVADRFSNPRGVFVSAEGYLYVADTNNERIVQLTLTGDFVREVGAPTSDVEGIIPEAFQYRPGKVVVDLARRMYVIVENVYDGILEFDVSGEFKGFIGAPRIAPNLIDYFWRLIATEAQKAGLARFLPTEYSNIALDQYGFIYAVVTGGDVRRNEYVRRLNPTGVDVLRRRGFHPPMGDIIYPQSWEDVSITGPSVLQDVVAQDYGVYSVLDRRRGRVFTYDAEGNLLYVFGGRGEQSGVTQNPVALEMMGDRFVVLDGLTGSITVYAPTEYAKSILKAIEYHNTGEYDKSAEMWQRVAHLNANYDLAYTGIGQSLMRQDRFREAMDAFRLGNNRLDYSEALGLYRREVLERNFGRIMLAIFLLILVGKLVSAARNRRRAAQYEAAVIVQALSTENKPLWQQIKEGVRYSLHVVFHPFDGFWDLKREKRGNVPAASILLMLVVLTYIIMRQYTGFIFNRRNLKELNILIELASVLGPFILWCGVNWALTTLMEGKGTPKDVYIFSAYALTPIILVNLPLTLVSNFLTVEEGAFYYFFLILSLVWSGGLLFFGTMVTHDYGGKKTFYTTIMMIIGIAIVLFLGLLFFTLIDKMVGFVRDIYTEFAFRL